MNDNEFWIKGWKYSVAGACLLAMLLFTSCQNTKFQVVRMVAAGANPIEARCAVEHAADRQMCAYATASKQQP